MNIRAIASFLGEKIQPFGLVTIGLLVVLLGRFSFTNPADAGPRSLLVTFALLYAFWSSLLLAIRMRNKNVFHIRAHAWIYSSTLVIGAAPVLVMGLASLGQLSFWDIVVIAVIEMVLYFYISYQFRTNGSSGHTKR